MITKYLRLAVLQGVYSLSFPLQQKYQNPLAYGQTSQLGKALSCSNAQASAFSLRTSPLKLQHQLGFGETR